MKYETFKQKEAFFSLRFIENEEELNHLFNTSSNTSIWRGQPKAEYKIYSTLQREYHKSKTIGNKQKQLEYIKKTINLAGKWHNCFFNRYFKNMGLKRGPTIYSLLSVLRHSEVPSPLIDWTRDFRIALYFAAKSYKNDETSNEINNYFSLIEIPQEHFFNRRNIKTELIKFYEKANKKKLKKLIRKKWFFCNTEKKYQEQLLLNFQDFITRPEFFEYWYNKTINLPERIEDKETDLIHFFINTNPKITNQSGLFILNIDPSLPLEESIIKSFNAEIERSKEVLGDFKFTNDNIPKLNCYEINSRLKELALEKLKDYGITEEYVCPNFDKLKDELLPI